MANQRYGVALERRKIEINKNSALSFDIRNRAWKNRKQRQGSYESKICSCPFLLLDTMSRSRMEGQDEMKKENFEKAAAALLENWQML